MPPEGFLELVRPILATLAKVPLNAWNDFVEWVPPEERACMFPIVRAGFLQWRMVAHAEMAFGTSGPIRMVCDDDGLHFLYLENGKHPVGIEFGKGDDGSLRRCKNPNEKNSAMHGQMAFWFYENQPKRLNLVYTIKGFGVDATMGRVALTIESKNRIEWKMYLDEQQGGDSAIGSPSPIAPAPSDPEVKVRPKQLPGRATGTKAKRSS